MLLPRLPTRFAWVSDFSVTYLAPAALINIGNAAAYLFQLVAGRSLGVEDYGSFNALLSAVLIVSSPANVLPLLVTQLALPLQGDKSLERDLTVWCLKWASLVGILVALLGASLLPALSSGFHVGPVATAMAIATVVASLLQPITVGLTQARRHYVPAAIIQGANPVVRLLLGLVLVGWLSGGVDGAMASVALPVLLTFVLGLVFLRDLRESPRSAITPQVGEIWRLSTVKQVLSVTGFAALSNLDVILAKALLSSEQSGLYAGAAVISRIALLLPSALNGIIFSESARHHTADRGTRRSSALTGLGLTALLAAPAALLFLFFGPQIAEFLLGRRFQQAGDILRLTGCSMGLLSLAQAAAMSLAGRGSFQYLWLLVGGTVLLASVASIAVHSAVELAWLTMGVNFGVMAGSALFWLRHHR